MICHGEGCVLERCPLLPSPFAGHGPETEENVAGESRGARGDKRQCEEQNKKAEEATEGARREGGSETEALKRLNVFFIGESCGGGQKELAEREALRHEL